MSTPAITFFASFVLVPAPCAISGLPPPLPSSFVRTAFRISPALRFFFLAASFVATTTFTLSAVIPPPITTAALSPSWPRTLVRSEERRVGKD